MNHQLVLLNDMLQSAFHFCASSNANIPYHKSRQVETGYSMQQFDNLFELHFVVSGHSGDSSGHFEK